MKASVEGGAAKRNPRLHGLAAWGLGAWGPGLLVMLSDTDAGNIVAAAQAGAQWNFRLLPLVLALIPALYLVQELAARLGLFTGEGFGELVRARYGKSVALTALGGLALATFGTLVTEFTGVAGIGELYGLSREATLPAAALVLLAVAAAGAWRRAELVALGAGLFECAFLVVAWKVRPHPVAMLRDFLHAPPGDAKSLANFLFLGAGLVGSAFSPWMVFYQQAATARRGLRTDDFAAVHADTAIGAVVTQVLTGAVLVAAAGALYAGDGVRVLNSIGEIGAALSGALGPDKALLFFSLGVLGASFAAAVVASLALSWGVSEIVSARRGEEGSGPSGLSGQMRFLGLYVVGIAAAGALVLFARDLVWLNIAAQVGNALMFPLVVGLLIALTARVLAPPLRLRGIRLALMIVLAVSVGLFGLVGAVAAFL
jgi:Mn2+/Fe2+ NRAMP family transporter